MSDTHFVCLSCESGNHYNCVNKGALARVCFCDTCESIMRDAENDLEKEKED